MSRVPKRRRPPDDLPLGSARRGPLAWAVAGLTAAAVAAFAVAAGARAELASTRLAERLVTITLPAGVDGGHALDELAAVLVAVRGLPGVVAAAAVPADEPRAEEAPWPLPRLVDVELARETPGDLVALTARVQEVAPRALVEDASAATAPERREKRWLVVLARAAGGLALLVLALVVGLATRLHLVAQADTVDLLRSMGASDGYLARQLERHALVSIWHGGLIGLALALALLLAFVCLDRLAPPGALPALTLAPLDVARLAAVPAMGLLVGGLAACLTARWRLARLG